MTHAQSLENFQMETDKHKTKVIFRAWNVGKFRGDVIALFPELPGTRSPCSCMSYEHIGQHGAADYEHVIASTRPILFGHECRSLASELRGLGYNLDIVQRCSHSMDVKRIEACHA